MKKILLGTTALVGAVSLFAGAALADTPKVTLGGFADFQVGFVGEDLDNAATGGADLRSGAFRSDTEVSIKIDGKTDGGLGYGGQIDLEADVDETSGLTGGSSGNSDIDNQGFNAARTFVYLDGQWGRVQMGSDLGVTNTMKVDASRIAHATGGIDGDWRYFITSNGVGAGTPQYLATPDLYMDYGLAGTAGQLGDESTENNNKISYYTPRFSGFQAGVSYMFSDTGRGQTINRPDNTSSDVDNILQGAITWEGKFDQVGIALGATGEMGDAEASATIEDLRTWQLGAKFTYMGFALAGSYGDWGDSYAAVGSGLDDRNFWTVGGSYEMGPFGASVTYFDSTYQVSTTADNEVNNLSIGVDYKLAPGFTPYAEVSFVELDTAVAADDNDATVFIAGTQLNF